MGALLCNDMAHILSYLQAKPVYQPYFPGSFIFPRPPSRERREEEDERPWERDFTGIADVSSSVRMPFGPPSFYILSYDTLDVLMKKGSLQRKKVCTVHLLHVL